MTYPRPFRFGVEANRIASPTALLAMARQAEDLGYASFFVDDHLSRGYGSIAGLATVATATTTIRVGSSVLANDFRNPVLLAKEMATIDVLSGGRLDLGLGTGYAGVDYRQTGIPLDPAGIRIERLGEAVQIIKGAFGTGPFTFAGRHYCVHDLDGQPKPLQQPHPPLLLGGGGRRLLTLAAREADIVSFIPRTAPGGGFDPATATAAATDEKIAWVRATAGDRFEQLDLNLVIGYVAVTDQRRQAAQHFLHTFRFADALTVEDALDCPHALIGTVEQMTEALWARRERYGISSFTVFSPWLATLGPIVAQLAGR